MNHVCFDILHNLISRVMYAHICAHAHKRDVEAYYTSPMNLLNYNEKRDISKHGELSNIFSTTIIGFAC